MIDYHDTAEDTVIDDVQVTDLENAAYLSKGKCIKGMLAGNKNWRSPEGHFKGELGRSSDLFSSGAVVSNFFLMTSVQTHIASVFLQCSGA